MSKNFLLVLAAIVVILGGIFIFTKNDSGSSGSNNSNTAQASNHTYGSGKSGVVLIEYGDFQCPACGSYYPIVKDIKEKFKDDIVFQFRHFPLPSHNNARAAHRAAEAASKQNKFWEMHDALYEQQTAWSSNTNPITIFENYAEQLGSDSVRFKQDYASSEVNDIINADVKAGQDIKANSTPTFVLDGKKLEENPSSPEAFEKLIADAIAAKNNQ